MDAGVKTKKPGAQVERARKGSEPGAGAVIKSVGIIGAGQMGNGIAHVVALAGYDVSINDLKKEAVDKARSTIERNMARQVSRGIITDAEMQAALKRIRVALRSAGRRRGRPRHRGRHRGRGGQAQDLRRPLSEAEEERDPRHQHLLDLHHPPRLRHRPARALHRHPFHEPGADDAAGRADPRHRHRGRDVRACQELHREPRQEHRRLGGLPGLHRQPHPAADDQRGGLYALRGRGHGRSRSTRPCAWAPTIRWARWSLPTSSAWTPACR